MGDYNLIDNVFTERKVEDAVRNLFAEDGVVYLVAGYFRRSGYFVMREAMKDFIGRNENNKIVVIVGTEPDQFSATIAYDLWQMDEDGSVDLLKFDSKFLHTKHYLRDNENPAVILGSANFTREGFEEHFELVSFYEAGDREDKLAQQHIKWFGDLVENCDPVTEEDLKKYEEKRIRVERVEEGELLQELGLSLQEVEEKFLQPDQYPIYYLNLLSHYLEVEDTTRNTIAIKSRVKKYPHQIIAASQAYQNLSYHGIYLLADEVGLGKTFEAGLALKQLKFTVKVNRVLIICNASAMRDWEDALKKLYESPALITSSRKAEWKKAGFTERGIWLKNDLMVCTHQMFRQAVEKGFTKKDDWDMLILDEAHVVKDNTSETHKVVKEFDVKYKLFLTATPVQNREKEFYNLFDAMEENFLGTSYESYKSKGEKYLRDLLQGEKESFLKRFLRKELPYMEIPPREVNDRFVKLSEEEYDVYSSFMDFLKDLVDRNKKSATHFVSIVYQKIAASSWFALESSMKRLRQKQEGGGTKEVTLSEFEDTIGDGEDSLSDEEEVLKVNMDLLSDLIKKLEELNNDNKLVETVDALSNILEEEGKIVVFTQYKRNILPENQIKENVTGKNLFMALKDSDKISYPIYTYHGSMNTTERYETRENFEKTGGIFLATEAGAESINLQHCNVMMNFDIPWNPARIEQRIGRIQRLGQPREVLIFNLVVSGTLDEAVYEKIVKKHNLLQQRFGTSEEVTHREALEAVESGSIEEINSTSEIFLKALKERKGPQEIKEYFEKQLDERDEELKKLRSRMEESLEDFDDRIKVLLSGKQEDTSETKKEIEELTRDYRDMLIEYLTHLRFTKNIDVEIDSEGNEAVLRGNEELVGDKKVHVALDGETSLFKDITLLTPKQNPLKKLIEETKSGFVLTTLKGEGGIFDFLVEIKSPINTIQKVIRVKTNGSTSEVSRKYPSEPEKIEDAQIDPDVFYSMLRKVYTRAKKFAEDSLEKEKNDLEEFVNSEVSRLYKHQSEEIRERVEKEVKEPIKLQEGKVKSIEENLKKGKATGKDLESAKKELHRRRSNRKQKEKKVREEVQEKYRKKIEEVRGKIEKCEYNLNLLSSCILKNE